MEIYRDGVEIDILPETAKCCADDTERNPLNINMCPIGEQYCSGDCDYYIENQNLRVSRLTVQDDFKLPRQYHDNQLSIEK